MEKITKKKTIDKDDMQRAVEEKDEKKLFFYFKQIASMKPYRNGEVEDWKMVAIARAFRYLPSYTPDRGLAFSYFYRIITMEMVYQYRRYKKMNRIEEYPYDSMENSLTYFDEHPDDADLVQIDGNVFDKDIITKIYQQYYTMCESAIKRNFKKDLKEQN